MKTIQKIILHALRSVQKQIPINLVAATVCVAAASTAHANLITNPSFETGDLTAWTWTPSGHSFRIAAGTIDPYNISARDGYSAFFGSNSGQDDVISQVLITTPGTSYRIDFWVDLHAHSYFRADWGGKNLLLDSDTSTAGWTHYSYTEVASGSSTTVSFAGRNAPEWLALDDISVAAVPEPSTFVMSAVLVLPFGMLVVRHLRQRSKAA